MMKKMDINWGEIAALFGFVCMTVGMWWMHPGLGLFATGIWWVVIGATMSDKSKEVSHDQERQGVRSQYGSAGVPGPSEAAK